LYLWYHSFLSGQDNIMNANMGVDFCWDDLLHYINMGNVIPVIGEGLYWVRQKADSAAEPFLLYPFLAQRFLVYMGMEPQQPKESFSQVMFRYQELHPGIDTNIHVKEFLRQEMESLELVPNQTLWQLAHMKKLGLFINTTYDNYLEETLSAVRDHPVKMFHYTLNKKWPTKPTDTLVEEVEEGESSLIFHIYGNASRSMAPAYTEKDILETIVSFQKDIDMDNKNSLLQKIQRSNLLFMGCRYDDWLFRFFIRAMSNKPFKQKRGDPDRPFIGDDFPSFGCGDLQRFLKAHGTEVFYSQENKELGAQLFQRMKEKHPGDILFPKVTKPVFISFHGADRAVATELVRQLAADGIPVWLDNQNLPAGERVDREIYTAIAARPVFLAIVSEHARQLQPETGTAIKYHIREWEYAYGQSSRNQNPKHIFPIIVDDTAWMWDSFRGILHLKIPGGQRTGEYDRLLARLQELLGPKKG